MRIFENKSIKRLFCLILVITALSEAFFLLAYGNKAGMFYIAAGFIVMTILILAVMYSYFYKQDKLMETAVYQIKEYISGNKPSGIVCDEEGELYRLFHEVNTLAGILNTRAQKEDSEKQFMKNTISDISHQLKTPLAALNIYNGIMKEEINDISLVKEFAKLSEKELERMESLVQNLLKITKLDAGTAVFEKKLENMSEMMKCLEEHFHFQAEIEKKNIAFYGDSCIGLYCDKGWVKEAISNIIKNAFDHTKEGDTITVEWRKTAEIVQIIIKDNGSGIHPEDIYHIFKRFYRSRFSKDSQGAGLGLPLSKAIVEAHNGTIEVDSILGRGSTFTLNFIITTNTTKM